MSAALIVIASVTVYLAGMIFLARMRYAATRPYTEPLLGREYGYDSKFAYTRSRESTITTDGEAAFFALLLGLIWPLVLPALGLMGLVTFRTPPLPEETAAKIKRLERELSLRDKP